MKTRSFYLKSLLMLALGLFLSSDLSAQAVKEGRANKETEAFRYELQCMGTGTQGTYLVKVWSYSRGPKVAMEQAKKNAVHGIIFKGFGQGENGCVAQKPLASNPNAEMEQEAFFEEFFESRGKYMKYVSETNDGNPGGDVLKYKKEYKVGVIVSVQKDLLRKDLEAAGIIKGLSSGF